MRHKQRAIEVLIVVIHFRENKRKFFCKKDCDNQNSKFNPCADSGCIHLENCSYRKVHLERACGNLQGIKITELNGLGWYGVLHTFQSIALLPGNLY